MLYGVISIIVSFAAFTALALSMEKHFLQIFGGVIGSSQKLLFQVAGWALLIVSLIPCLQHWGTAIGIGVWLGILSLSGSVLVTGLSYIKKDQ